MNSNPFVSGSLLVSKLGSVLGGPKTESTIITEILSIFREFGFRRFGKTSKSNTHPGKRIRFQMPNIPIRVTIGPDCINMYLVTRFSMLSVYLRGEKSAKKGGKLQTTASHFLRVRVTPATPMAIIAVLMDVRPAIHKLHTKIKHEKRVCTVDEAIDILTTIRGYLEKKYPTLLTTDQWGKKGK